MNWLLIGLAAFVAWQVVQDRRKYTPPVCPPGSNPMQQMSDSNSHIERPIYTGECVLANANALVAGKPSSVSDIIAAREISSVGSAHWDGVTPYLSQAVLLSMTDDEIAAEAAWGNDIGARAESVRRGIRYTYTQWHELKSRMQGRDGSRDADLLDLGRDPAPLTAEEYRVVDWGWSKTHAIGL